MAALLVLLFATLPATAQTDTEVDVELLQQGQDVYIQNCSGCHQPSGAGLPGSFPPLLDNPNVQDSAYVRDVIMNGRTGVIEVNGQTFDGVMPPVTGLDDGQIDAVIAFVQNGLVVPGAAPAEAPAGPAAGTQLPPFATAMSSLAYLLVLILAALVIGPRVIGVIDRRAVAPLDAALKAILIVAYFVLGTVFVPSFVLQTEVVSRLPGAVQDVVAGSLWLGALAIGIIGLWWFQRQDRI